VFIAIAALNSRMNVQSPWGSGLMVHTDLLKYGNVDFRNYYNDNVRNVGDILFEITSMMSNTLTGFNQNEFTDIVDFVPDTENINVQVIQINKHLNDSTSVQNIRSLYSQKKDYQSQLNEVQKEIDDINATLASVSFDDVSGVRTAYTDRLTSLSSRRNELVTSITKTIDEISIAANNSETPIENAKYRIRGFFDIDGLARRDHIKGIRVQYRYKNVDQEQGTAFTMADKFVFSDWNDMHSFDRERISSYSNGRYNFNIEEYNGNRNEPSFNQIDIPISQGETVDIRLKVVYDYGSPFVTVSSNWSNIINVEFPDDYLKNVQVLDIISENNNDIETNRFQNILKDGGVPDHIGDKVTDQDITYFHKPENIASGFYTAERRIIPLKDKLSALDSALAELKSEVFGASENLQVTIKHGQSVYDLSPFQTKEIQMEEYNAFTNEGSQDGLYEKKDAVISTVMYISLYNDSDNVVKLYSIFPGDRDHKLDTEDSGEYSGVRDGYVYKTLSGGLKGIGIFYNSNTSEARSTQSQNQFIYFRTKNPYSGKTYYTTIVDDNTLYVGEENTLNGGRKSTMYPKVQLGNSLCLDTDEIESYMAIGPHEEILIPIIFKYDLSSGVKSTSKTMSFDIRKSLYKDPTNYSFRVTAKNANTTQDKLIINSGRQMRKWWGDKLVRWTPKIK
jgi:hypothetical protein